MCESERVFWAGRCPRRRGPEDTEGRLPPPCPPPWTPSGETESPAGLWVRETPPAAAGPRSPSRCPQCPLPELLRVPGSVVAVVVVAAVAALAAPEKWTAAPAPHGGQRRGHGRRHDPSGGARGGHGPPGGPPGPLSRPPSRSGRTSLWRPPPGCTSAPGLRRAPSARQPRGVLPRRGNLHWRPHCSADAIGRVPGLTFGNGRLPSGPNPGKLKIGGQRKTPESSE